MIKITIKTPTKCIVENLSEKERSDLEAQLTYNNTSAMFNLKALKKNHWLKQNRPQTYHMRMKELEDQLQGCMLQTCPETGLPCFNPGYISYIKYLQFEVVNEIVYPEIKKIPWSHTLPFELYPYQKESVERLIDAKHGCVELCTGAGKTGIILTLAREMGLRTVIVTPSKSIFLEILEQAEYHLGKSNVGAYGDGKKKLGKLITVCVSKSLSMVKPGSKEEDFFNNIQLVISDESHLNAAETLEKVFHGLLKDVPYRMFLSGTQVRGDGKDKLLHAIIGKKVHELSTREAIDGGYICPVKFFVFKTKSNSRSKSTEPLIAKREHFLYNENVANIIAKISNSSWEFGGQSTLILVDELEQIRMLISKLTVPYEYVHSASKAEALKFGLETKKVDNTVMRFNKGEVKVLIGTSCIATGTNIYPTHNTVNWVGGTSEVKTKQGAVGRSVRVLEKSKFASFHNSKPFSKIYDFEISNNPIMVRQLEKRIEMYKETCDTIKYIEV
jgi:superfamily II DNA or RNA helicase